MDAVAVVGRARRHPRGGGRPLPTARAYGLAGYLYGSSPVRARDYFAGTLIGATPSAISYAIVGALIAAPGDVSPLAMLPLGAGLLFSAIVLIRARRRYRREALVSSAGAQPV